MDRPRPACNIPSNGSPGKRGAAEKDDVTCDATPPPSPQVCGPRVRIPLGAVTVNHVKEYCTRGLPRRPPLDQSWGLDDRKLPAMFPLCSPYAERQQIARAVMVIAIPGPNQVIRTCCFGYLELYCVVDRDLGRRLTQYFIIHGVLCSFLLRELYFCAQNEVLGSIPHDDAIESDNQERFADVQLPTATEFMQRMGMAFAPEFLATLRTPGLHVVSPAGPTALVQSPPPSTPLPPIQPAAPKAADLTEDSPGLPASGDLVPLSPDARMEVIIEDFFYLATS